MKRMAVALMLVGILCGGALAQDTGTGTPTPPPSPGQGQPGPGGGPGGHHGGPIDQLGLTDQQKQQVRSIMQAQHQKMRQLQQDTDNQLKQVLTPEQFAKLQQLRQQLHRHRPGGPGQGGPPPADN
ncbi:MAG: hypothetical protein ACYCW6_01375 [Candidatus Xenobia bacterium]